MKYGRYYSENFADLFESGDITIDGVDYTCDSYYYNGDTFVLVNCGEEYFDEEKEEKVSEVIEVARLSNEEGYFVIIDDNNKINVFTIKDLEL